MKEEPRITATGRPELSDSVRVHYNRRALWGSDSLLYRKQHPMKWIKAEGTYQNWEVNTTDLVPEDSVSAEGAAAKLFFSDDVNVWLSRRRQSMPYFFRNADADELHLVSRGAMTYETDFGNIEVGEQEMLVIPKGVTYRVVLAEPQETLRMIFESVPEIFLVPADMISHVYREGRAPVNPERVSRPTLPTASPPEGEFQVRVKYSAAFAAFTGDMSTLTYDRYPAGDLQVVDGVEHVYKFGVSEIERFAGPPLPFIGGRYLDNKQNLAWTLHLTGAAGPTPSASQFGGSVHRDADVDELRYESFGPTAGCFVFTPQCVDHGIRRGYTDLEKNAEGKSYQSPWTITAYTIRPLKGTEISYRCATPTLA